MDEIYSILVPAYRICVEYFSLKTTKYKKEWVVYVLI
jgi:hypothetical protein